jgi:hypothetical protein
MNNICRFCPGRECATDLDRVLLLIIQAKLPVKWQLRLWRPAIAAVEVDVTGWPLCTSLLFRWFFLNSARGGQTGAVGYTNVTGQNRVRLFRSVSFNPSNKETWESMLAIQGSGGRPKHRLSRNILLKSNCNEVGARARWRTLRTLRTFGTLCTFGLVVHVWAGCAHSGCARLAVVAAAAAV